MLEAFYDRCLAEPGGENTLVRLTLAPETTLIDGLREMNRVMDQAKRGECTPFDDSAECMVARVEPE